MKKLLLAVSLIFSTDIVDAAGFHEPQVEPVSIPEEVHSETNSDEMNLLLLLLLLLITL